MWSKARDVRHALSFTPSRSMLPKNGSKEDLTSVNSENKKERERETSKYLLPEEVFIKNRTVSKENQEKLLQKLMDDNKYGIFQRIIKRAVTVEDFLKNRWMWKILKVFFEAGLIDNITFKRYTAITITYYKNGFKGILEYEIKQARAGKKKTVDKAYSEAFESLRGVLEHRIPKILSLFESIITYVAQCKGDDVSTFSLSHIRRYYEYGVKSALGEALIEYGFPTDAVRRIEERHSNLCKLGVDLAKDYCRSNYPSIKSLLDSYEDQLFVKAMRSI